MSVSVRPSVSVCSIPGAGVCVVAWCPVCFLVIFIWLLVLVSGRCRVGLVVHIMSVVVCCCLCKCVSFLLIWLCVRWSGQLSMSLPKATKVLRFANTPLTHQRCISAHEHHVLVVVPLSTHIMLRHGDQLKRPHEHCVYNKLSNANPSRYDGPRASWMRQTASPCTTRRKIWAMDKTDH